MRPTAVPASAGWTAELFTLTNCIVRENYARGNGGGVYLRDGRVTSSLIFNNNSDQNGGAVYVDNEGPGSPLHARQQLSAQRCGSLP